jgi:signal peptidase I
MSWSNKASFERARPVREQLTAVSLIEQGLRTCGAVTVPVTGDSMLPTLQPGDRVVLRRPDVTRLQAGDVVAFRMAGRLVIHRIHGRDRAHFITAGDNLGLYDPPVAIEDVIGVATDVLAFTRRAAAPTNLSDTCSGEWVDVWLISHDHPAAGFDLPPGWRLHVRPPHGIGVAKPVLEEIRAAVAGKPCIGVTEHAVLTIAEGMPQRVAAGTQVIIGCSFGQFDTSLPGHLLPPKLAGLHLRPRAPGEPTDALTSLREFAAAATRTQVGSPP